MSVLLLCASLLCADSEGTRIDKEIVVPARLAKVWQTWTTNDGVAGTLAAEAKIEMKLGGAYEWYFSKDAPAGSRGSEGCKVLSFIPYRMLAFSWNAPPKLAELRKQGVRTQVVIRFFAEGKSTRVKLTQTGFGSGADWEQYYAYFDKAWPMVLNNLRNNLKGGEEMVNDRQESKVGNVNVKTNSGSIREQEFDIVVAVPVQKVWETIATTDGFRKFAKTAEIELTPGGKYAVWPGAPNKVLAFVPGEMLSVSGSAPEKFPNLRKGGTWGAYILEPLAKGNTRITLISTGFQSDNKEHMEGFEYFLKANPQFLTMLAKTMEENFKHAPAENAPESKTPPVQK